GVLAAEFEVGEGAVAEGGPEEGFGGGHGAPEGAGGGAAGGGGVAGGHGSLSLRQPSPVRPHPPPPSPPRGRGAAASSAVSESCIVADRRGSSLSAASVRPRTALTPWPPLPRKGEGERCRRERLPRSPHRPSEERSPLPRKGEGARG